MDIRRFRALRSAGATFAEIARETGCDWRTVKKYLDPDAPSTQPRAPSRMGTQPKVITPFVDVVDAWLRAEPRLKESVIHERLVAQYGFTGNYQRVTMYLQEAVYRSETRFGYAAWEYSLIIPLRTFRRRTQTVARSVTGVGRVSTAGGRWSRP